MDLENRSDLFDSGDRTALVCMDVPEVQRIVVEQLNELGYKIHTGLFVEDILLKMRAHSYDVLVVSAHFNATALEHNPILTSVNAVSASQRRCQFVTLVGSSFTTGDELQSFQQSVELVVALPDVANLKPVLRRSTLRHREFYAPFFEAERASASN
ncbi:MAG: hypothetical protein M3463_06400 [Verrucomicrobiota bacterium]|nr:hypothetical protein [Verrucomicrobiota bacterium]